MIRTDILQGTDEWLRFRDGKIGASDFCVIAAHYGLCENIFNRSLAKMIEDKITGKKQESNMHFAMGKELEPIIIQSIPNIELQVGEVCVSDLNNRIIASLDGRDITENVPVEVKSTKKNDERLGISYFYYQFQVIHQCYVLNSDKGLLLFSRVDKGGKVTEQLLYDVFPEQILSKADWLRMCVETLDKLDNYYDNTSAKLIAEYRYIEKQFKEIESLKKGVKDKIVELYPNGKINHEFNLSAVSTTTAKYAAYIKDNKIEVPDSYKTTEIKYTLTLKDLLKGKSNGK